MWKKILILILFGLVLPNSFAGVWTLKTEIQEGVFLTNYNDDLYATNWFCDLGFYDGDTETWTDVGDFSPEDNCWEITVYDGNIFTGGDQVGTYTAGVWTKLWGVAEGETIQTFAIYDGNLFTGGSSGTLGTYKDGIWTSIIGVGDDITTVLVYDGNLFTVGFSQLGTYKDGIWTSIHSLSSQTAIVYDGNIFAVSTEGLLQTYNNDSKILTSLGYITEGGAGATSFAIYDGNLFTGDERGVMGTYKDGTFTPLYDICLYSIYSMMVYDGNLFTGCDNDWHGEIGTYTSENPPTPHIPSATLDIAPVFQGVTGMFNIFSGVVGGVAMHAPDIGELVAIAIILTAVVGIAAGLFLVFRKSVQGWM